MTGLRPHPSTSTKTTSNNRRFNPAFRRSTSPHNETEMPAPLTQEPLTSPRPFPPGSPQSRVRSPGHRHSSPPYSADSLVEQALSASTETLGEDEANTTSLTLQPNDTTDLAPNNDNPMLAGPQRDLPSHIQTSSVSGPFQSAPVSTVHDPPSSVPFHHLERHLTQLEAQWKETCEELYEVARKAEDVFSKPEMLEWQRQRCQWLQGQERSLRSDIQRLIPLPLDPNLTPVHTAWMTYNETLRSYLLQHHHQQP